MNSSVAIITGASSGIGLELAKIMASKGHDLILVARREEELTKLAEELKSSNRTIWVYPADLSRTNAAKDLFVWTKSNNIYPEILVNNAGFGDMTAFPQSDLKKLQEMIQLNMVALTELTWYFLPEMMRRKKGYILNIGSTASFIPGPGMAVYHATKAFVLNFGESLREELRGSGVSLTTLCPGPTRSGFQEKANMQNAWLFNQAPLPDSKEVASLGYKSMMEKKSISVHGFANKMIPLMTRIFPRSWVSRSVKKIYQLKHA
jgi:short-subunit dehydrogenase